MFGTDGFTISAVIFTKAETVIPGVRTEYLRDNGGVKFHFWADPEFPEKFGENIEEAFSGFPKRNIIVEFVSEVDSWYGEIKNLDMLSDPLIETLVGKISKVVARNGKE